MIWLLMWLNRSVTTINATLQLLNIYIYIYVRTRFGSLTQKVDGLKTKKPKTMNL